MLCQTAGDHARCALCDQRHYLDIDKRISHTHQGIPSHSQSCPGCRAAPNHEQNASPYLPYPGMCIVVPALSICLCLVLIVALLKWLDERKAKSALKKQE